MGPAPRGGASRRRPRPHATSLLGLETWSCFRWSPSDWIGRSQEEPAGVCPALSGSGPGCGGTASLGSRTWEVARGRRAFRELFLPPGGGGTLGAASRSPTRYAQVRPGAGRQRLVHILAGLGPAPSCLGPWIGPNGGPRPARALTPRRRSAAGGGTEAGPGRWGPALGVLRALPARPLCK